MRYPAGGVYICGVIVDMGWYTDMLVRSQTVRPSGQLLRKSGIGRNDKITEACTAAAAAVTALGVYLLLRL